MLLKLHCCECTILIWVTHIKANNSDILSLDILGARQRETNNQKENDIKIVV